MHLLRHLLLSTSGFVAALGASGEPYNHGLVAEAGLNGTRMYLFNVVDDANGKARVEMTNLGTGPPLSSFLNSPSDAADAISTQIDKAMEIIPESEQASVGLAVFGMAGMRSMDQENASAIYEALENGIMDGSYPFDDTAFLARTISGREEGVCAFIAANYLTHRTGIDLQVINADLMGVLDLRSHSSLIAVPPKLGVGETLGWHLDESHMFIRNFPSFGEEWMREETYNELLTSQHINHHSNSSVMNPCAFVGYNDTDNAWHGTGHALECQMTIAYVLKVVKEECEEEKRDDCLPMHPVKSPQQATDSRKTHFLLTEGYFAIVDFAQWWLDHGAEYKVGMIQGLVSGHPKEEATEALAHKEDHFLDIAELKAAAKVLCSAPWGNISAVVKESQHRLTKPQHVPHRCFELNYVITLLSVGYGFSDSSHSFQFVEKLDGLDADWSLGAFLLGRAQLETTDDKTPEETSTDETRTLNTAGTGSWLPINCLVVGLAMAIFYFFARRWECLPKSDEIQMGKMA